MMKEPTAPGLLSQEAAASYLGLSEETLKAWRYQNRGPRYCKLGKRVTYRECDLQEFIAQQVTNPGEEPCQKYLNEETATTSASEKEEETSGGHSAREIAKLLRKQQQNSPPKLSALNLGLLPQG